LTESSGVLKARRVVVVAVVSFEGISVSETTQWHRATRQPVVIVVIETAEWTLSRDGNKEGLEVGVVDLFDPDVHSCRTPER
jgi:hypothetical protein